MSNSNINNKRLSLGFMVAATRTFAASEEGQ
jgi:hypothetical protein